MRLLLATLILSGLIVPRLPDWVQDRTHPAGQRRDDERPRLPDAKVVPTKSGEPAAVELAPIDKDVLTALREAKLTAEEWSKYCKVVVAKGKPAEVGARPGVAGSWSVTADAIRFEPQFPLVPGIEYLITCRLHDMPQLKFKAHGFSLTLLIPKPLPGPPTTIAGVYPSASFLPENTLRLYVQFSAPMTRGNVYRHFKLVRDDGKEVASPFLELDEELWSPDGTRLTLLFQPGRVKRGLKPREEDGPILEEGHAYTLEIDRKWEDAEGRPLAAGYRKTFFAGPPDEKAVDPGAWSMMAPRAGGDAPLILRLPKPHDRALLGSMLSVVDADGKRVEGTVTVGGGERVVTFAPAKPWARGEYRLVIDARLEDVCGNRVGEPFEVDLFDPPEKRPATTTDRPFVVR